MTRPGLRALPFLWLASALCLADPLHAVADGAYWHHDSGWVFPAKAGEFALVGVPQDVAGSREAVAYYAREASGSRTVVSVSVYPAESEPAPPGDPELLVHFVTQGHWRVVIRLQAPVADAATLESLDAFVREQRWESLDGG